MIKQERHVGTVSSAFDEKNGRSPFWTKAESTVHIEPEAVIGLMEEEKSYNPSIQWSTWV